MRITYRLPAALAGLGLLLSTAPASTAQETGTITGQVVWGGDQLPELAPKVQRGANVKDAQVCSADDVPNEEIVIDPQTKGVQNCIVYLVNPSGQNPEAEQALIDGQPEVVVDQEACRFIPHVAVAHEKQTVVFKSSDPVGHNVRLQGFSNPAINVMLQPNGELKQDFRAERRPMRLSCDIHPWMQGYVMVFDHPFFAVTDEQGNFEISGVPAGSYQLVVWQESVGYVTPGLARGDAVTVQAGQPTEYGATVDPTKVRLSR